MIEFLSKIDLKKIIQYAVYTFLLLLFQNMLLTHIRIGGVCCMFLPAAVVAVTMFEGNMFSIAFSIILGIYADMAFVENTILFTVSFPLLSFAVSFLCRFYINKQFFAYMVTAAAACAAVAVIQLINTLVKDSWSMSMLSTAFLQVLWSLPFAAFVYPWPASQAKIGKATV